MANDVKDSVQAPKKEISLQMLWHVFVANIIWICGVAILVAGIAGVYTKFFVRAVAKRIVFVMMSYRTAKLESLRSTFSTLARIIVNRFIFASCFTF